MNNNLQLFLSFVLCRFVEGFFYRDGILHSAYDKCLNLKNINLDIPQNDLVSGEEKNGDASWYKYINWHKPPVGRLEVRYVRYFNGKIRVATLAQDYSIRPEEESDWEEFAKDLLGLTHGFPTIPGKVEVPQNLLDGEPPCRHIKLENTVYSGQYIVNLIYWDAAGNWLLSGNITFNN